MLQPRNPLQDVVYKADREAALEQQDARQDWLLENAVQRARGAELWPLPVPPN